MVGWFSPGTPVSSTTKVGRHDIPEILLKVALRHQKSIKIIEDINVVFLQPVLYLTLFELLYLSHRDDVRHLRV